MQQQTKDFLTIFEFVTPIPLNLRLKAARARQPKKVDVFKAGKLIGRSGASYAGYERGDVAIPPELLRILAKAWNAPELLEPDDPATGFAPYVGSLPASKWAPSEHDGSTFISVPREYADGNHVVATIRGDSMFPTIHDGDKVIIRSTSSPPIGKIAVVRAGGGDYTVKRYMMVGGRAILVADNEDTDPIEPRESEIVGYVVRLIDRPL